MPIFRTNKRANQKQTVMKKERKSMLFKLMLTPTEKEWVDQKAKDTGLTRAQVVRFYYINNINETQGKFQNIDYERAE
jgi:hypothetical protein